MRETLRIATSEGQGNLSAQAYMAAVVGPYRLAHGRQSSITVSATAPTQIAKNAGAAAQALFVSVTLPASNAGPVSFWVGPGNTMGDASPVVSLVNRPGFLAGSSYSAVLLPGDELYMQVASGGVAVRVAATLVSF